MADRTLGDELNRLARRLGGATRPAQMQLATAWPAIVGEEIAAHTCVLALRRGELLIGADSPVWASELSLMSELIMKRITDVVGETPVSSIRFTVSREVERERSRRDAEKRAAEGYREDGPRKPAELTAEEEARVRRHVEGVADGRLREAAYRAMVADLRWKKGIEAMKEAESESGGLTEGNSR